MNVLVIAAHPDDEILGVGGTILRHVGEGDEVHVHIACCHGLRDRERRIADAERVRDAIGCDYSFGWLPELSTTERDARPVVERLVADHTPDIVYTHHPGDLNRDHRALNEAVAVACRPYASAIRSLRLFETPSSTEWGAGQFRPSLFVAVDASHKARLLEMYASETRPLPHPRHPISLMHRAYYWGSIAGLTAAEPFEVVRETW
jgi:LmbE family N-acetylglucosaminyl deacetylase